MSAENSGTRGETHPALVRWLRRRAFASYARDEPPIRIMRPRAGDRRLRAPTRLRCGRGGARDPAGHRRTWRRRGTAAISAAIWRASRIPTWCSSRAGVSSATGRARSTIISAIMAAIRRGAGGCISSTSGSRCSAPDAAQLISRYRLEGGERPQDGINTRLMRKVDGRWVIALNHVSSRRCPRLSLRPRSRSISSAFQNRAQVWVPWPRVSALAGIRT